MNQTQDKAGKRDRAEILPKAGHKDVGKEVMRLVSDVLEDKLSLGLHQKWLEHYRMGRNLHWKRGSNAVPLVSANLLHSHRQRTVNTLTDNDPTFALMSMSPESASESVQNLQRCCEYWWNEQEQQMVYEETVRNGETYGITVEKVLFNPDLEYGIGEIETVLVDPYHFGLYPVKCRDIQRAEAVLYFFPLSVREARRRWPDKADEIKPDSEFLDMLGDERREISRGSSDDGFMARLGSSIRALLSRAGGKKGKSGKFDDETLIVECWVRDYSGVYTGNIRCVTVCGGGFLVLEDKDNPSINPELPPEQAMDSYLYDKMPFAKANSVTDPSSFWGMSDFEQLEQLQKEFNKSLSQMVFLKDKSARPKVINPMDSGVDNSEFTNAPGILNPTSRMTGEGIRYLDFPQAPFDIEKVAGLLKDLFFLVAGTFELENAQTPGREVIAHRAIETLIEHASTMMRGKIRNYSKLLRERGRMFVSHAQNWYTESRWFAWEQNGKPQLGSIRAEQVAFPIRLTVMNGSTLPVSQASRREETIKLVELNLIDQQDALEKLDWSGREEVISRMQQGANGELLRRMGQMGMPQQILDMIGQIGSMKPEDFDKMAEQGKVPMLTPPDPAAVGADPTVNAELQVLQAKAALEAANRELVLEKAKTEQVMQRVHLEGVEFDKEKLRIEKAQTQIGAAEVESDMQAKQHEQALSIRDREHEEVKTRESLNQAEHSRDLEARKTEDQLAASEQSRKLAESQHIETFRAQAADRKFKIQQHKDSLVQAEKERRVKERGLKSNNKRPTKRR